MSHSQMGTKHSHILPLPSAGCDRYLLLFRTYVSRTSAGKGRAVLEGIGLAPETIKACYSSHPLNEEEAVQDGLNKWAEGHHGYSPTWRVLLNAMVYAGIGQQHCQGLREELYQMLRSECVCVCVCVCAVYVCVCACMGVRLHVYACVYVIKGTQRAIIQLHVASLLVVTNMCMLSNTYVYYVH